MCQCPERGDLHFYFKRVDAGCTEKDCVNALKGATFISTQTLCMRFIREACVNALKGATFISTLKRQDIRK